MSEWDDGKRARGGANAMEGPCLRCGQRHVFEWCADEINEKVPPPAAAQPVAPYVEPILQFFRWFHLPESLAAVSRPFGLMAEHVVHTLPRNPERTVALRKLLEAKDAAVRASLFV